MKQEYKQKLVSLDNKIQTLNREKDERLTQIKKHLGISDEYLASFDWDKDSIYSAECILSYSWDQMETENEFEPKIRYLNAEYAALFLIATHIARKNKPLHGDYAEKKLKKYGENGQRVLNEINASFASPMILYATSYLHTILYKKYKVKLLDENYARYLNASITRGKSDIEFITTNYGGNLEMINIIQQKINCYQKELNMFHKAIRDKIVNQDERPF